MASARRWKSGIGLTQTSHCVGNETISRSEAIRDNPLPLVIAAAAIADWSAARMAAPFPRKPIDSTPAAQA